MDADYPTKGVNIPRRNTASKLAVTQGHGNPDWTRDETILALELYLKLDGNVPSPKSEDIRQLSALLRLLPYHAEAAKRPTFRNPDGVGFKLMNIRHVATGKGLGKVSEMDRRIWADFGDRPDEVYRLEHRTINRTHIQRR